MAFKWIYFLVLLIVVAVFEHVQAAAQLRLVNGLLIIEDRQPPSSLLLETSRNGTTGSGSSSSSIRSALRESRSDDLHGHGYLNKRISSGGALGRNDRRQQKKPVPAANVFLLGSSGLLNDDTPPSAIKSTTGTETILRTEEPSSTTQTTTQVTSTESDKEEKDSKEEEDNKLVGHHTTAVNSVTSPTMDVITIIWYFSTFIALVAFFVVMVCSDKYCTRSSAKPEEAVISAPATPAPSYREFAPPSYDSVMRKHKSRVFIIPMLNESGELKVADDAANVEAANQLQPSEGNPQRQRSVGAVLEPDQQQQQRRDAERSPEKSGSRVQGEVSVMVVVNEGRPEEKSASDSSNESR